MFSGIRKNFGLDFLDDKIAEEQEKQKKQQPLPGKRPQRRTGEATTTRPQVGPAPKESASKGPDPENFVIGEDASDVSQNATASGYRHVSLNGIVIQPSSLPWKQDIDAVSKVSNTTTLVPGAKGKERATESSTPQVPVEIELPAEVQQKLHKLEQLTTRYQELLRNYRTAHAHVAAIEPFEATLREHTPLTSISDPGALVEFLNQRNLQSEMVLGELKRITNDHNETVKERDELKKQLEEKDKKPVTPPIPPNHGATEVTNDTPASSRRMETLESAVKTLQKQRNDADAAKKLVESENADLEAQVSTLKQRLTGEATLKEQIEELKEEREDLKQDILDHGGAAADAKHALQESTQRLEAMESEKAGLEAQISTLEQRLVGEAVLKEQIQELNEEREVLKEECEELKEECENRKQDFLDLGNAAAHLKQELQQRTERLKAMESEKADLEAQTSGFNRDQSTVLQDKNDQIAGLEAHISTLEQRLAVKDRNAGEMGQMRDALDASRNLSIKLEKEKLEMHKILEERLVRFENEKLELHKTLEDRDTRLERLQKSAHSMTEQLSQLQTAKKAASESVTSSRAPNDGSRVTTPAPRPSAAAAQSSPVDTTYLKSVLLQYMEQKEKKHRLQLVPVISQLLKMSKEDEQRWYAAVQGKW